MRAPQPMQGRRITSTRSLPAAGARIPFGARRVARQVAAASAMQSRPGGSW
jgi:hypothetical protein